ncbi:MAG: hypothetical protein U0324_27175 [Polyangiales bacterium]
MQALPRRRRPRPHRLHDVGYGLGDPRLPLTLVYNPLEALAALA